MFCCCQVVNLKDITTANEWPRRDGRGGHFSESPIADGDGDGDGGPRLRGLCQGRDVQQGK